MTCYQSSQCSHVEATDAAVINPSAPKLKTKGPNKGLPTANRTVKIRVFPRHEDILKLKQWFGCYRAIYNDALTYMTDNRGRVRDEDEATLQSRFSSKTIKGQSNPYFQEKPYLLQLKSVCRKLAVRELNKAMASNLAKKAKTTSHRFRIRYKRRKAAQTLPIEAVSIRRLDNGNVKLFGNAFGKEGWLTGADNRSIQFDFESTLHLDELGRVWLHAPLYRQDEADTAISGTVRGKCAIDPGVHTFLTVYDPDHNLIKLGDGSATEYFKKLYKLDTKLRLKNQLHQKTRRPSRSEQQHGINAPRRGNHHLRRRIDREIWSLRSKLKNMTADLHWKCSDLLTKKYDTIAIPTFETRQMSSKANRKLTTKTVRNMQTLAHYTFRQRLLHKASLRNTTVIVMNEAYTSMTCTICGALNRSLGGAQRFDCSVCGVAYDRDSGGARNCFLKTYTGNLIATPSVPGVAVDL